METPTLVRCASANATNATRMSRTIGSPIILRWRPTKPRGPWSAVAMVSRPGWGAVQVLWRKMGEK